MATPEEERLTANEEILLQEYAVCNDKAHSYMAVCWQIGAIFITASILMLGISAQIFPKPIGVLLIFVTWITLCTWYRIFERINWICAIAYNRAKAIEQFMAKSHEEISSLKFTDSDTTIETKTINLWIHEKDKTLEGSKLKLTKYIHCLLWILVAISLLMLAFYISFLVGGILPHHFRFFIF